MSAKNGLFSVCVCEPRITSPLCMTGRRHLAAAGRFKTLVKDFNSTKYQPQLEIRPDFFRHQQTVVVLGFPRMVRWRVEMSTFPYPRHPNTS